MIEGKKKERERDLVSGRDIKIHKYIKQINKSVIKQGTK